MTAARTVLAIDLGRTGCRAALWVEGEDQPSATACGAGTLGLTAQHGAAQAEHAILAVTAPLLERQRIKRVDAAGIGAPGVMIAPDAARELAMRMLRSLPARGVALASDAVTSHAGALAGLPGVVLAAGTGAVVVAIGARGQFRRVDGWGPWLGDEGSGAWLGLAGLRAAARAEDGRGPATSLRASAWEQFGGPAELALQISAADNPGRVVASFVPVVASAARSGDAVAIGLIREAADALARSVLAGAAVLADDAPVAVAIVGGLTELGAILLDPLRQALREAALPLQLCEVAGTSLEGARRIALHDGGIHEPWVVRAGALAHASAPGQAA